MPANTEQLVIRGQRTASSEQSCRLLVANAGHRNTGTRRAHDDLLFQVEYDDTQKRQVALQNLYHWAPHAGAEASGKGPLVRTSQTQAVFLECSPGRKATSGLRNGSRGRARLGGERRSRRNLVLT